SAPFSASANRPAPSKNSRIVTARGSSLPAAINVTAVASGRLSYCQRARSSRVLTSARLPGVNSRELAVGADIGRIYINSIHIVSVQFGVVRAHTKLFFKEHRKLDQ